MPDWKRSPGFPVSQLSDDVVFDPLRVGGGSHLRSINPYFDRCLQIGGSSDGLGSELVDRVILSENAHHRDEKSQVDDLEVIGQGVHGIADR